MDLDLALSFPFRAILDMGKKYYKAMLHGLSLYLMITLVTRHHCCLMCSTSVPVFLGGQVIQIGDELPLPHPIIKREFFVPRLGFTSLLIDDHDGDRSRKKRQIRGQTRKITPIALWETIRTENCLIALC